MIFVEKIDKGVQIAKYLLSRFPKFICREKRPDHIIHTFMANLTTILRTQFLSDLRLDETQIWIYTEYTGMGINLPDISCVIQFKISDYIILPKLLQQLGCGGRNASCIAVAMVFIEMWQILPDDIHILEGSIFKDLWLLVTCKNCDQITDIIVRLYCKHICSNAPKTKNTYQRTDPAVLWFLSTTGCRH